MLKKLFGFAVNTAIYGLLVGLIGFAGLLTYFNQGLPDHTQLKSYYPDTVSRFYSADGRLVAEYAAENRVFVPIEAIPDRVVGAFIAAEDRNFYSHVGVDPIGILRAMISNIFSSSLQGASTITQQVAKNMLLTRERTLDRKLRELILAFRMSYTFSKDRIMELYLNEIYLGAGSYGVAAAALNYFNKSIDELNIQEAAMLASLPKAPSYYNPWRYPDRIIERRNWVIRGMAKLEYIPEHIVDYVAATPIHLTRRDAKVVDQANYFTDEVRRRIEENFGEDLLYTGGVTVHSTLDVKMQRLAEKVLREGLVEYDKNQGYRGRVTKLSSAEDWAYKLKQLKRPAGIGDWQLAVVLDEQKKSYSIGVEDGTEGFITKKALYWIDRGRHGRKRKENSKAQLQSGDVVMVKLRPKQTNSYALRQIPQVNGALVAMDPHTGRVLALVGGYDFEDSQFNRATQAKRQPGSAFKPFVYLTGLEDGFTPASLIADEPIEFNINRRLTGDEKAAVERAMARGDIEEAEALITPVWAPQNYSGSFYGPTTLRKGLEKSLNVMTVHLGMVTGLNKVTDVAEKLKIYQDAPEYLSVVLGSHETTLLNLTNAYAMLVNGGKKTHPAVIERIQDRSGKSIYRRDSRVCVGCSLMGVDPESIGPTVGVPENTLLSEEQEMLNAILAPPAITDTRRQTIDQHHAYQMVSMLEGVIQRGTGIRAKSLGLTLAGKTGTTNDSRDAWFVGFSPDLVVGVYVGFDDPQSLGENAEGSNTALPIFMDFMKTALRKAPKIPFRTPSGIRMVKIDRETGFLPTPETKADEILLEAFISGSEPTRAVARNSMLPVINPASAVASEEYGTEILDAKTIRGTGELY